MQDAQARQDSLQRAQLTQIISVQQRTYDSLAALNRALLAFRGELMGQFYEVQKSLIQVQELTGQSTRRLSEMRGDLDARGQQMAPARGRAGREQRDGGADVRGVAAAAPPRQHGHRAGRVPAVPPAVPHGARGAGRPVLHRRELFPGGARTPRPRTTRRSPTSIPPHRGPRARSTGSAPWPNPARTRRPRGATTSG